MIKEIIKKYGHFHDAVVKSITYSRNTDEDGKIIIKIRAINNQTIKYEDITLTFETILSFRFIEAHPFYSLIINNALLIEKEAIITFDFFPDIYSDRLELNKASDFCITCKHLSYTISDQS